MSDEIVDAMSERKKNLHAKYGINGGIETSTINSKKLFRYKYQVKSNSFVLQFMADQYWVHYRQREDGLNVNTINGITKKCKTNMFR